MKTASYKTGREYNGQQTLDIEYPEFTGSIWDAELDPYFVEQVKMTDDSRGLSYLIPVLRCECTPQAVGPAVLHGYDSNLGKPI